MTEPESSQHNEPTLAVSEIFGPTIQGEGPTAGTPCFFLRLAGCNQKCTWCDTPYTWDWSRFNPRQEITRLPISEAINRLTALSEQNPLINRLIISGGEPLLQQAALYSLLIRLRCTPLLHAGVEIETAGTVPLDPRLSGCLARLNISLKLASSGNPEAVRINPDAILSFQRNSTTKCWKFVVSPASAEADFAEIAALVDRFALTPVYVMPEGKTASDALLNAKLLLPEIIKRGWRLTPRLHTILFDNERCK